MIDAATIGVTLALNDGVSEGIARIRRDLANLDAAVANSALRLSQLLAIAADAGSAIAVRVAPAVEPALPRPAGMPVPSDTGGERPAAVATAPISTEPTSVRSSAPESVVEPPPARPARHEDRRDFASFGHLLAARVEEDTGRRPVPPPLPNTGAESTAAPSAWRGDDDPSMSAGPEIPPLPTVPVRVPMAPMTAPPTGRPTGPRGGDAPETGALSLAAARDQVEPTAVEITLDGSVLARWMATELGQQAARPPAGAGVFDPRISPAWLSA